MMRATEAPAFQSVTIQASPVGPGAKGWGIGLGSGVFWATQSLRNLIAFGYDTQGYLISGPDALDAKYHFDASARRAGLPGWTMKALTRRGPWFAKCLRTGFTFQSSRNAVRFRVRARRGRRKRSNDSRCGKRSEHRRPCYFHSWEWGTDGRLRRVALGAAGRPVLDQTGTDASVRFRRSIGK